MKNDTPATLNTTLLNDIFFPESVMRGFIGADRLKHQLKLNAAQTSGAFPPHNIEQTGDDSYILSLALAGYSQDDIEMSVHNGILAIESAKQQASSDENVYLHRGISFRSFKREFVLGEHIQITSATMENGLLKVFLNRIVPEEAKPKRILIGGDAPNTVSHAAISDKAAHFAKISDKNNPIK